MDIIPLRKPSLTSVLRLAVPLMHHSPLLPHHGMVHTTACSCLLHCLHSQLECELWEVVARFGLGITQLGQIAFTRKRSTTKLWIDDKKRQTISLDPGILGNFITLNYILLNDINIPQKRKCALRVEGSLAVSLKHRQIGQRSRGDYAVIQAPTQQVYLTSLSPQWRWTLKPLLIWYHVPQAYFSF